MKDEYDFMDRLKFWFNENCVNGIFQGDCIVMSQNDYTTYYNLLIPEHRNLSKVGFSEPHILFKFIPVVFRGSLDDGVFVSGKEDKNG